MQNKLAIAKLALKELIRLIQFKQVPITHLCKFKLEFLIEQYINEESQQKLSFKSSHAKPRDGNKYEAWFRKNIFYLENDDGTSRKMDFSKESDKKLLIALLSNVLSKLEEKKGGKKKSKQPSIKAYKESCRKAINSLEKLKNEHQKILTELKKDAITQRLNNIVTRVNESGNKELKEAFLCTETKEIVFLVGEDGNLRRLNYQEHEQEINNILDMAIKYYKDERKCKEKPDNKIQTLADGIKVVDEILFDSTTNDFLEEVGRRDFLRTPSPFLYDASGEELKEMIALPPRS